MPYTSRLKRSFSILALVSWLLLVGNIILCISSKVDFNYTSVYTHINNLLTVVFIFAMFMGQQNNTEHFRGTDFLSYLWRLFGRAGIAAYICLVIHFGYLFLSRHWLPDNIYLQNIIYNVNFALFIYFLAKAFNTWKRLILFQKSKTLHIEWRWFEWLIYGSLLLTLFNINYVTYIFIPLLCLLVLYILFVCVNLRWVAYLTIAKKWRSIVLLGAILLSVFLFAWYFRAQAANQQLVVDHFDHSFVLLMMFFVFMYALASLLVTVFSLPTSSVFEQKRDDLLNIQKLSQSIQQGQTESQVFDLLFDSAIRASQADAAWLEIPGEEETVTHMLNLDQVQVDRI